MVLRSLWGATGNGVIVHHDDGVGLIVTDRNTVSINAGDVLVSFGAYPAETHAKIVFLHPLYNYAVLLYSSKDLPAEVDILMAMALLHSLRDVAPLQHFVVSN